MYSGQKVLWAVSLLFPMIFCVGAFGYITSDDDVPEVTARVVRITFVSGEVQIRRSGSTDWEKAAIDLPVVEGDEIATGSDGRVEIQLDSFGHLRLDKKSVLRISTLKDDGTAVSVSQGTLSVRLLEFDKGKSFMEIDAPKTTVAIQKAGMYRIDAGSADDKQVRIAATESGEARVYSESSGFTLKNGRSSTLNIEGDLAGEWQTADAAKLADEFDSWALDRDVAITKKLKDAFYDKYYDRDIFGAEDLNDYGEWVNTKDYGYVWKPYQSVISKYDDWSPYRYGEWRWVPPFGWTWVNDEPWGWATYHHGRWFYDNGYWYWSPYGYHRNTRSWWVSAIVAITVVDNNYCWYPLPYHSRYRDCNWRYHRDRNDRRWADKDRRRENPRQPDPPVARKEPPRRRPPDPSIPPGGIITVPGDRFGTGRGAAGKALPELARRVLERDPDDDETIPSLPKAEEVATRMGGRVRPETPIYVPRDRDTSTGIIERKGKPVDDELRITRVMDRRIPVESRPTANSGNKQVEQGERVNRDTGVVKRPVKTQDPGGSEPPRRSLPPSRETPPQAPSGDAPPKIDPPRRSVEPRQDQPTVQPRIEPPTRKADRDSDPPRREQPRSDPSPKEESPRSSPPPTREQPRSEPPPKSEPTKQEQPRSEPTRSQPKEDSKPSSPPSRQKNG